MEEGLNLLYKAISKSISPNLADKELCADLFDYVSLPRNSVLEGANKIPGYLYFIISGYIRAFSVDEKGNQITSAIAAPNSFITSFLSFVNNIASDENVSCITNCDVLRITRSNLQKLIENSESFKKFSLVIFENSIADTQARANDLVVLTAQERYRKLMRKQPELILYVPAQYIASYLGIKPQSLSRIRAQLTN